MPGVVGSEDAVAVRRAEKLTLDGDVGAALPWKKGGKSPLRSKIKAGTFNVPVEGGQVAPPRLASRSWWLVVGGWSRWMQGKAGALQKRKGQGLQPAEGRGPRPSTIHHPPSTIEFLLEEAPSLKFLPLSESSPARSRCFLFFFFFLFFLTPSP